MELVSLKMQLSVDEGSDADTGLRQALMSQEAVTGIADGIRLPPGASISVLHALILPDGKVIYTVAMRH